MKPPPSGWPRIAPAVFYEDAPAAIDWLCRAFGFEVAVKVEGADGDIVHSQLRYGEGLVMVGSTRREPHRASPRSVGGRNTQALLLQVDDADAHCAHARAAGARILMEPTTTDHGERFWADRLYTAEDCEGHHWWFSQRVRDPPPA